MLGGQRANVIRVGNLTNRASDFMFQPNYESNAFLSRVRAVIELGMLPNYVIPLYSEFSPIDETARAIVLSARYYNDKRKVLHIYNPHGVYFDRLISTLGKLGINIDVLDGAAFAKRLRSMADNPDTRYIYEALINDMDENGNLVYDANIKIDGTATTSYLKKLGFEWHKIDEAYLRGYVEYFKRLGYLKV